MSNKKKMFAKSFTTIDLAVVNIEHKTSPRFLAEFCISQQSWKKAAGMQVPPARKVKKHDPCEWRESQNNCYFEEGCENLKFYPEEDWKRFPTLSHSSAVSVWSD